MAATKRLKKAAEKPEPQIALGDTGQEVSAFAEIGRSGLRQFGGYLQEEFLRELQYAQGRKLYREMADNDPIVGACLAVTRQFLRQVPVTVQDGDNPQANELVRTAFTDTSRTWQDLMSEILTCLVYGWSMLEIVYKRRGGDVEDPTQRSKYTDGLIGWRKFAPRSQESLQKWIYDPADESLRGARFQPPPTYMTTYIPIEKALLFRTDTVRDSPEGRSILRTAYIPYYRCKRIAIIEGIGIERDLTGFPIVRVPGGVIKKAGAELEDWKDFGRNIRRDDQECAVLPSDRGPDGNYTHTLELVASPSRRSLDTTEIIKRYQVEMATALLCDFVLLGHDRVGSFALADSKVNVFTLALRGWSDAILEVFNGFAIPRLLKLNGMDANQQPRLVAGDIDTPDLAALGAYVQQIGGTFPELSMVPGVLDALLRAANLPTSEQGDAVQKAARRVYDEIGSVPFSQTRTELEEITKALARYDGIDFTPPKAVADEAARGLEWRREYGRGGTEVGVARATQLSNQRTVSPSTIQRMVSYFARHDGEGDNEQDNGEPSAGAIAWRLWGGDAGRRWAEKVRDQMASRDAA